MIRYRAAWILPITEPPIKNGWVDVKDGVVAAVGTGHSDERLSSVTVLESCVVMPGLINAHTHLELSGFHGCVERSDSMPSWASTVMSLTANNDPDQNAIDSAISFAHQSGTALVGDISNTLASVDALRRSPLDGVVFNELLGFDNREPTGLLNRSLASIKNYQGHKPRVSLAAHAPYSVSAALFKALREAADAHALGPLSVHVAESEAELEFLRTGTGPWRDILELRGRWVSDWKPPAEGPIDYLDRLGWVQSDTLMVHGVHLTDHELERLAAAGTTLVSCPRSNIRTGAGQAPLDRFYSSGVRVALGTDSLASVDDLNMFTELQEARRLAPDVSASSLIKSATLHGARALGFADHFGAIEAGRRAALIAVSGVSPNDDVEEYLLGGIRPEQVGWLESGIG